MTNKELLDSLQECIEATATHIKALEAVAGTLDEAEDVMDVVDGLDITHAKLTLARIEVKRVLAIRPKER